MAETNSAELVKQTLLFVALVYKILLAYIEEIYNLVKPIRRKSVRGQNVLITGSGHGLGREMALRFATEGANLVLVDINQANNESVRAELIKKYADIKVRAYSVDIRNEADVEDLSKRVQKDVGQIDVLVNNAGIVQCKPFLELSPQLIERTLQVNVLAHMWTIRHFLPSMLEKGRGHIVAISSIAGLIGGKFLTDYW
jgi:all-trans-retinol dehydrogenase (NAD+)